MVRAGGSALAVGGGSVGHAEVVTLRLLLTVADQTTVLLPPR